jgi:hypothetical protein
MTPALFQGSFHFAGRRLPDQPGSVSAKTLGTRTPRIREQTRYTSDVRVENGRDIAAVPGARSAQSVCVLIRTLH